MTETSFTSSWRYVLIMKLIFCPLDVMLWWRNVLLAERSPDILCTFDATSPRPLPISASSFRRGYLYLNSVCGAIFAYEWDAFIFVISLFMKLNWVHLCVLYLGIENFNRLLWCVRCRRFLKIMNWPWNLWGPSENTENRLNNRSSNWRIFTPGARQSDVP